MKNRNVPVLIGLLLAAPVCWAGVVVGRPAPAFSLSDAAGQPRSLAEFSGQFVVLEWVNPDCPFVRKHYDSGNMQGLQQTYTQKGVAWLSINSSAPGKQGHLTTETAQQFVKERAAYPTAVLLDPDGVVGRRYGAKTTPHMFIIDPKGILIYAGAIDDIASPDPADISEAVNYVATALEEAMDGQPVSVPASHPYGCTVKY
ncbi:MAG: thioredoxin family protein [Candidatus Omnitrophica bacterium]|nr:thioredoxin family protein [Candidatus Omnitrophota bacterium]